MLDLFERWVVPLNAATATKFPRQTWRFLWACAEGVRPALVALAVCTAALGALEASMYSLLADLVDALGPARPITAPGDRHMADFMWLCVVLLVTTTLVAIQTGLKYQAITASLVARVRWRFHCAILERPLAFFDGDIAGRLAATVMQCSLAVRVAWVVLADILVFVAIYFAGLATLAAALSPPLLLPFLAWLALYGMALRHFVPRIGRLGQDQAGARARVTGLVSDAYANAHVLQAFSTVDNELIQIRPAMQELLENTRRQLRTVSRFEIANHLLGALLLASTAGLSVWLWSQGQVGAGAVAATTATALRLHGIAQFVMTQLTLLFDNLGVIEDGAAILASPLACAADPQRSKIRVTCGAIRFEHVEFGYAADRSVLRDIHLHVQPGERVGIVGPSGAGKSTLLHLLLGLRVPRSGRILVDGQDLQASCGPSVREHMALVSQETALLHRSVADNIALGRPFATRREIEQAAIAAGADSFIRNLVDPWGRRGYEAVVGDRGLTLSGGQRQRIAVARALLRNCPILLLDEPTRSLDVQAESIVQEQLHAHMAGRTVLAISHQLADLQHMDRLVVLVDGEIVEEGHHDHLLAGRGVYADLWKLQQGPAPGTRADHSSGRRVAGSLQPP